MKCLLKYKWVKLPREIVIDDKGIMNHYMKQSSRAAFRKGISLYCKTYKILNDPQELGYLTYTLDRQTEQLTYRITDWVMKCPGADITATVHRFPEIPEPQRILELRHPDLHPL